VAAKGTRFTSEAVWLTSLARFSQSRLNPRELILNDLKTKKQFAGGMVEGPNNKVKVTMRTSYGFRTFRITEVARYHALAKLPEPELTHHFSDESFYNLVDS
jgi:transposase